MKLIDSAQSSSRNKIFFNENSNFFAKKLRLKLKKLKDENLNFKIQKIYN